ncbi:hypothetical protein F7725_026117 [Dissostichus mawsoni]|uniref:phosphatidate phosphatase n=1 Tax=Dissostichus mawsoni TaxID=36200 RepID=A0A7J5X656_DISMA|nr:hypothetical protein F7725_026117 [Dissostichus mawsoni]
MYRILDIFHSRHGAMAHMDEQDFSSHSEDDSLNGSWTWNDHVLNQQLISLHDLKPTRLQTMNYVGQLAGQVFVQVKELYRGLNPATLSGCIDVIVVRQPDGTLKCSPFHVRFGKMGVLRSSEKLVDIEINGEPVSLHMKLGENGEAFFVKETENTMEIVPSYLATSPIVSTGAELMESQLGRGTFRHHGGRGGGRHDQRQVEEEGGEESDEEFSEDQDMFTIDLSSDEEREGDSSHGIKTVETLSIPSACGLSISCPQQTSHFPPHPAFLTDHQKQHPLPVVSIPPGESAAHSEDKDTEESKSGARAGLTMTTVDRPGVGEVENVGQSCAEIEGLSASSVSPRILIDHLEEGGAGESPIRSTDSPSKRKEKRSQHLGADGIYLDDITELQPEVAALYFPKSDGGSSSMRGDSELMMMGVRSANQSPHSEGSSGMGSSGMGSSGMDSGVDSLSDHIGDLPHVSISLCGGLTDNREITRDQFQERAISYKQFSENPSLIDDPNLVVKIGNKYYNWNTAAPVMLAMQVYQKPLPQVSVENIMKEKMPKKGGRWWFSWRSRNSDSKSVRISDGWGGDSGESSLTMPSMNSRKDESSSSDEDNRSSNQASGSCQPEPLMSPGSVFYKKTLRLNSEQLASLQLKEGANEVVFSVTTQYQGTCRCHGTIYLWSWDDKIVISDIDGTITRSDTLGHILPTLGKDWTHQGIARFYHKVSQNGYKFMFCSARAIGMADMTRGYLHWVNERGTMLPMGPVLLSPSSLFSALHREVIEKKPEKFKIECLSDIKQLFYPNTEPFYAAFGNRATDVYSYKEVGVPLNRIFTVNPKGELIQEHAKTNISSYVRLCEMVDHDFPLLAPNEGADLPRSDTFDQCYWNKELPEGTDKQDEEPQPLEAS